MFDGLFGNLGFGQKERPRDQALASSALRSTGLSSAFTDAARPLGDSIKTFQANNGLKQDGVMTPGGPTELALKAETARNDVRNLGGDVPSLVRLSDGVGPGQPNRPQDVETVGTLMQGSGALRRMQDANRSLGKLPGGKLPGGKLPKAKQPSAKQPPAKQAAGRQPAPASPRSDPYAMAEKSGLGITGLTGAAAQPPAQPIPASQARGGEPQEGTLLDQAIRWFQEGFGLEPDGVIKPGGPTERRMDDVFSPPIVANIMDPSTVGGPAKPSPPGPFMTPYGIRYPENGHLDANGVFVPDPDPNAFKLRVNTPQGEQELTLQEFMTHYPDRPVRWPNLPSPLNMTLGPHRLRPFSGERVARYRAEQAEVRRQTAFTNPGFEEEEAAFNKAMAEREAKPGIASLLDPDEDAAFNDASNAYTSARENHAAFAGARAAMEEANRQTGMTFARTGETATVGLPDGTTVDGVSVAAATRMAAVVAENPDYADLAQEVLTGTVSLDAMGQDLAQLNALKDVRDALDQQIAEAEAADPYGVDDPNHGSATLKAERAKLTEQVQARGIADLASLDAEIQKYSGAYRATEAQQAGASSRNVGDVLIAGVTEDPLVDPKAMIEIALSIHPAIGAGMDAAELAHESTALIDAIEAEDWDAVQSSGLGSGLILAGYIPGVRTARKIGKALKGGNGPGRMLINGVKTHVIDKYKAGYDEVIAQYEVGRFLEEGERTRTMTKAEIQNKKKGEDGTLLEEPNDPALPIYEDLSAQTLLAQGDDAAGLVAWRAEQLAEIDAVSKARDKATEAWQEQNAAAQNAWRADPANAGKPVPEILVDPPELPDLPANLAASLQNRINQQFGAKGERYGKDRMKTAGLDVVEPARASDNYLRAPKTGRGAHAGTPQNSRKTRRPDAVIAGKVEVQNGRVRQTEFEPRQDGKNQVTTVEIKAEGAEVPSHQGTFDEGINSGSSPRTKGDKDTVAAGAFDARIPLHKLPLEDLQSTMSKIVGDPQYGFSAEQQKAMMDSLAEFHAKSRGREKGYSFSAYVVANWNGLKRVFGGSTRPDPQGPR